jgi:excisionase family DNA binding protein
VADQEHVLEELRHQPVIGDGADVTRPSAIIADFCWQTVSRPETAHVTPEPWSTITEVAAHLQVAEDTILRWIQRKGFPAHRAGRVWRFQISEVDEWMRNGSGATKLHPTAARPGSP